MTLQKRKFLKISTSLAILLASAGLSLGSPDLAERTSTQVEATKTTPQTSAWPPALTSEPRDERVRQAALEPVVEAKTRPKTDLAAPKVEQKTYNARKPHKKQAKQDRDFEPIEVFTPRVRIVRPQFHIVRPFGFRRRWF